MISTRRTCLPTRKLVTWLPISPPGTGVTSGAQVFPDAAQLGSFGSASLARYQCTCALGEQLSSVQDKDAYRELPKERAARWAAATL